MIPVACWDIQTCTLGLGQMNTVLTYFPHPRTWTLCGISWSSWWKRMWSWSWNFRGAWSGPQDPLGRVSLAWGKGGDLGVKADSLSGEDLFSSPY